MWLQYWLHSFIAKWPKSVWRIQILRNLCLFGKKLKLNWKIITNRRDLFWRKRKVIRRIHATFYISKESYFNEKEVILNQGWCKSWFDLKTISRKFGFLLIHQLWFAWKGEMFINPKNLVEHTFPSGNLTNFPAGSKIHCNNLSVEFEVDNIHYVMRMIHIASSNMFRNLVHSNIQGWLSQFLQLQEAFDFQDNPLQKHLLIGSKNFEDNFLVY